MQLIMIILGLISLNSAQADLIESVFFTSDSAMVEPGEVLKLEAVADSISKGRFEVVILVGNADKRASNQYNFDLAKRRAEAVRDFLNALGVEDEIKITLSQGEEEPTSPRLDVNRRVDIHLFAKKQLVRQDKNMLILHLGIMPQGVKALEKAPYRVKVGQDLDPGAGLTYMRRLYKGWHLGATVLTNPTATINIGCSF